jgi:hypothetical protein
MKAHARIVVFGLVILSAAVLVTRDAGAVGEQNGRIKGTISEPQTGVGLPGVTVTARGPSLIGGPRTVGTSDGGRYEIANLPPGAYTVEISYAGAKPMLRLVVVRPGETAPLNVQWTPEDTGVQTVTVSEPRPIAKPDSAEVGTVLSQETMARIPTDRTYQGVASFVPGVTDDGSGNPNIRGGLSLQNRYLVDGLDITDPVTGTFSANLNFDALGTVQVLTGGMEAQYNSLGGIINVTTAGGSEDFHADVSLYVNHQKLTATGPFGPQLYDGRQDFNDIKLGPTKSYQANLNVGGPILRKRLWFNASYELDITSFSTVPGPPLGAPPYNIQHPPRTFTGHQMRVKLTWAPSPTHRFTLSTNADPAKIENAAQVEKNSLLGVAEQRQDQGGFFSIASWDWFLSPNLNTNLQAGFQVNTIENGPQGRLGSIDSAGCDKFSPINCTWEADRPQHVNLVDNTQWYQGGAYDLDKRYTVQIDPSVSLRGRAAGFHDVKAGVQTRINYRTEHFEAPGKYQYSDLTDPGLPLEAGLCDPASADGLGCFRRTELPPYDVKENAYSVGFYVQDRWWTPLTWLTVVPGIRFDYGHTSDRNGNTVSSLFGIGPRLGVVADITRDGRNVISASYGRANEVLSLLPTAYFDSVETGVSITTEYDPVTHDFTNPINRSGGPGGVVIDKNLTTPHSDEVIINARRQVFTSTLLGVTYTWKRVTNFWDQIEINQIWDPSGARVVGYADSTKEGQQVFLYSTPSENHRTYQGFDLYVEGRPTRNWDLSGSYTLSWLYGPGQTEFQQITPYSQFVNPRYTRYFDGFLPEDTRHTLKGFAAYRVGPVNIGTALSYQTGNPRTKRFFTAQDGAYTRYRSPLGTEPGGGNDPKEISEFRLPDILTADLRVTVNVLPRSLDQRLSLIADIFNIFNNRTTTAVTTTDVARFGQVAARQNPLRVQLGLNYVY